jgi:hypothetical protein
MKRGILWVILLTMPTRTMPTYAAPSRQGSIRLTEDSQVRAALDWLHNNLASIDQTQIRLTEIPAPSFQESARAAAVKALLEEAGLHTEIDRTGNVIAKLPGANAGNANHKNSTINKIR